MEELFFDTAIVMDTSRAQQYIEEHPLLQGPQKDKCHVFRNGTVVVDEELKNLEKSFDKPITIDHKLRAKLITLIEENGLLFYQLEYLIRNIDMEATRKQLHLIYQYMHCYDAKWYKESVYNFILMTDNSPLYCLGYILGSIYRCENAHLVTTPKTAPLCHLFYQMCLFAGIHVTLIVINEQDIDLFDGYPVYEESGGCTAVYTENADIQSAVDVFVNSSPMAPWRIDRMLVQENVYEEVIEALEARGQRIGDRPQFLEAVWTRRGVVAVPVGECGADVVPLVTYRTAAELAALLAASRAPYLALWCAQTAPALQLAAAASARYVWLDNHADFGGPPEVALAVYTAPTAYTRLDAASYARLDRLSAEWTTLELYERKAIVLEAMEKSLLESDSHLAAYRSVGNWKPKDLTLMETDKTTMVVDCPKREIICVNELSAALELILRGYRVLLKDDSKGTAGLIALMSNDGIPIMAQSEIKADIKIPIKAHFDSKKVIQMTYGTVNAN